jgi:hypothetical protein
VVWLRTHQHSLVMAAYWRDPISAEFGFLTTK